jgi:hypothetical protein
MSFFGIALFSSLFLFTASSTRGDKPRVLLLGPDGCAKDYPVSLLSCHLKDIIMCIEVASPCTVLSVLFGGAFIIIFLNIIWNVQCGPNVCSRYAISGGY